MVSRREFLQTGSLAGAGFVISGQWSAPLAYAAALPVPGAQIQKWAMRLPLPTAMPKAGSMGGVDYYSIAVTEFQQQVLPPAQFGPTTLWGYGGTFPSRTIEARVGQPIQVQWVNGL